MVDYREILRCYSLGYSRKQISLTVHSSHHHIIHGGIVYILRYILQQCSLSRAILSHEADTVFLANQKGDVGEEVFISEVHAEVLD